MSFAKTLSCDEMKNITAGWVDEYGCTYTGGTASCRSYYDCLTFVCASKAPSEGWDSSTCVEQVQSLRLKC